MTGTRRHNGDGNGTIYIESKRPLTSYTQTQLAAARHACGSHTTTYADARHFCIAPCKQA